MDDRCNAGLSDFIVGKSAAQTHILFRSGVISSADGTEPANAIFLYNI